MSEAKARIAKTATEALRALWEERFFLTWKEKKPIVDALAKKGNHFSDAELGMALLRCPVLTRRGKRGHYQYVQKYPFAPDDHENPRAQKGAGREKGTANRAAAAD